MAFDTDVLIVGGGPTGLMLAAELAKFGVNFRLIDKSEDRVRESRAIVIQSRSMELFQNLGVSDKFLKKINSAKMAQFNYQGKRIARFNLTDSLKEETTPFPSVFFLPQYETESILIQHLKEKGIQVERPKELVKITPYHSGVRVEVKDTFYQSTEKIHCRYLVAADGAKSFVRDALQVPFKGTTHEQEFLLADAELDKPWMDSNIVQAFLNKGHLAIFFPLNENITRVIGSSFFETKDVEKLVSEATDGQASVKKLQWISKFKVHHRSVEHYQVGRVFFAGDAAHVHSPVGGQGMNTGLQDAANLGWKLAYVLKGYSREHLLTTYEAERKPVGKKLVETTDRAFSFLVSQNFILSKFRDYVIPFVLKHHSFFNLNERSLFGFISQLHIKYPQGEIVEEIGEQEDANFTHAAKAGLRAPDAKLGDSTLFEIFQSAPSHLLLFGFGPQEQDSSLLKFIQTKYKNLMRVHFFNVSQEHEEIFARYGVLSSAVYFIRPDGHVGFKSFGTELKDLKIYLKRLMGRSLKAKKEPVVRNQGLRLIKSGEDIHPPLH